MAPPTRQNPLRASPIERLNRANATPRRRSKFIDLLARQGHRRPINHISYECGISYSCGRKWRAEYKALGEEAKHMPRKRSTVLGRKSRVTKELCKSLVATTNPVRKQPLVTQISYHNIPIGKRQLQRKIKEHTKGGGRYLCAFIKKVISRANRDTRIAFGERHIYDALFGFFDHVIYTDEAHIDPTSQSQGRVLREQGTRDLPENIEQRPPLKGVRFHIAAWISWHGKAERLIFYNDENDGQDGEEDVPYPQHPRRRPKTESEEEYKERVRLWEASKPHKVEKQVKGNAMTQKYYVEHLLPVYCAAVESIRQIDRKPWLLQEDGDPSHGIRKEGLAQEYKKARNITNLSHPAQSPDLNPIEGIWAILKQRIRKKIFDSEEEMREALQDEWAKITMDEIRHRIADLPRRCAELVRSKGGPIRGNKW